MSTAYNGIDSFPTGVTLIDDGEAPNEVNFGVAPKGITDRTLYLANRGALEAASNFPVGQTTWVFTPCTVPAWDEHGHRWLIGNLAGTCVYESYDCVNWVQLGGALSGYPVIIVPRASDGVVAVVKQNGTTANLLPASDTWNQATGPSFAVTGSQGGIYYEHGGYFLVWETRPSVQAKLYKSTNALAYDADQGGSWPAGFGHNGATTYTILAAQSSTRMVWFTTRPGFTSYSYTDDMVTFVTAAMPTIAVGELVTGITFCSVRSEFLLITYDPGSTNTYIWASPSGAASSWTLRKTFTAIPGQGIVANSGDGVSLLASMVRAGVTNYQVVLSVDGGSNWRVARFKPVNAPGTLYSARGHQLFYYDNSVFACSLARYPSIY